MPQGGIVLYVAEAISSFLAGTGVSWATVYAIATVVVYSAAAYAMSAAMRAMTPKPPKSKGAGYEVNYSGTFEARRIIYGEIKVGGMHTIPPICTGSDGKFLNVCITLAGHECSAITDVYLDNKVVYSAQIGVVTGTANDGIVTATEFYNIAWIRRYLGTSTQTVDYILSQAYPAAFTADFRGRGIAYVAAQFKFSPKVYQGVPNITAVVQGKKCYDPRTGTTIYTSNPAIIVRDYLVSEVGFASAQIDDTLINAAANICDQTVAPGTQKRYQCNILLSTAETWEENLRSIIDSMRGRCVFRDGVWRIYAGTWDAAGVAITQSDWIGSTRVKASAPAEERWNAVRVWYVDKARSYQRVECFPRRNTSYETTDGDRIWMELEIPGCTNEYEAQRHGEFCLRASRNQLTIAGRLRPEFIKLSVWDTVTVTDSDYGWSSKTFRVLSMDMSQDGGVDVALVEEGSATWTDLAVGEYNTWDTVVTIDPGYSTPSGRAGFTQTPYAGSISFRWDISSEQMPGELTRLIEYTSSGYANLGTELWRGNATALNIAKTDATTRYYWLQGVVGSYVGAYTPNTYGLPSAANSGGSGSPGEDGISATLSLPSVTLPADVNGTVANYGAARGRFSVFKGSADATSYATHAVTSQAGLTGEINNANGTPWASNTKADYHVTAVTSNVGVLHMTATYSGTVYPRQFVVSKALTGSGGPQGDPGTAAGLLTLNAAGQTFNFSGSSTNIGVSTIGFNAVLQNVAGTAVFYANNYRTDGTLLSSYDLSGSGNSNRGLHINSFTQNNSTAYCTVVASITGGYTDRVTVVRVQGGGGGDQGPQGDPGISAWQTNLTPPTFTAQANSIMGGWLLVAGAGGLNACVVHNDVMGPYRDYPNTLYIRGMDVASLWTAQYRHYFAVDDYKAYVHYVAVMVPNSGGRTAYAGYSDASSHFEDAAGNQITSVYFLPAQAADTNNSFKSNRWYLGVGVIAPASSVLTTSMMGVYDFETGSKTYTPNSFVRHTAGVNTQWLRFGTYVGSVTGVTPPNSAQGMYWMPIGTFVMDGTHPTVEQVLNRLSVPGMSAYLTNENYSLPASSNGYVPGYSGANGMMVTMLGVNSINVNSITFSTVANSGTLTHVFSTNGTYAVTAGLDEADPYGALTLRAATFGTNLDKVFTLGKNIGGIIGGTVYSLDLKATSQQFRFDSVGSSTGVTTIGFDAMLGNLSGTAGFRASNYRADGVAISSYDLSGSGNTNRGLHVNSFVAAGSTAYATIVTSISGGYNDQITVIRTQQGATGDEGGGQFTLITHGTGSLTKTTQSFDCYYSLYAWDQGCYTAESYVGGSFVSATPEISTPAAALGLNSDPTTDASYTSIDYCFYIATSSTTAYAYENGSAMATFSGLTITTSTIFSIVYDGAYVRYFIDGVLKRTVWAGAGRKFYLDSSLYGVGNGWFNVRFGPVGAASFVSLLTNESQTLVSSSNGNVPSYTGASGQMRVYAGTEEITSATSWSGCGSLVFSVNSNPQSLTATINNSGYYAVTAGLADGTDSALLYLRTVVQSGPTLDNIFSLGKSKGGTPGGMGPPGGNLLTNGDFTSINSVTGRVAAWDGSSTASSYDLNGGPGETACFIANSWGTRLTYLSEVPIPVNPMNEALEIEFWLRSVNSGLSVYMAMDCIDYKNQSIGLDRDQLLGTSRVFSTVPMGANSYAAFKNTHENGDMNFPGWPNSWIHLSIPDCNPNSWYYMKNWPEDTTLSSSTVRVSTINTTFSTSFDIIGLVGPYTVPNTVPYGYQFGVGQLGVTYRYFPNGTGGVTVCNSTWTRYTQRYFGQPTPWLRFTQSGVAGEKDTFRTHSRKVQFRFFSNAGGSQFEVAQFIVRRTQFISGTLVHDKNMLGGGGMWAWQQNFTEVSSYPPRIKYSPTSGPAGGGMFVLSTGSAYYDMNRVGGTTWDS